MCNVFLDFGFSISKILFQTIYDDHQIFRHYYIFICQPKYINMKYFYNKFPSIVCWRRMHFVTYFYSVCSKICIITYNSMKARIKLNSVHLPETSDGKRADQHRYIDRNDEAMRVALDNYYLLSYNYGRSKITLFPLTSQLIWDNFLLLLISFATFRWFSVKLLFGECSRSSYPIGRP